jgi:multiple sugar transport system permease protein
VPDLPPAGLDRHTYLPLQVPYWLGGGAFNVFLPRQVMSSISPELDDAAKIDGCSFFGIRWRIMLLLVKPAPAAVAIFSFLRHWNDFFHPVCPSTAPPSGR